MESTNHLPLTDAAASIAALVIGLLILAAFITIFVFYLLTLQKALNHCSPENRAMQPGLVWLLLIPCFSPIWHFLVVFNLAKSLDTEFQKRALREPPQPGKHIGLAMCILAVLADVCSAIGIIPLLGLPFALGGIVFGFGGLVCWIVYWVQIAGYSRKLAS